MFRVAKTNYGGIFMFKKSLAAFLAVVMVLSIMPFNIFASAEKAQTNDGDAVAQIAEQLQDKSNDPFDYTSEELAEEAEQVDYPASFDLRSVDTNGDGVGDKSYVTPVKFQNPFGTCWGFAAIAAAETSILGSGIADENYYDADTLDLSEKHLVYFSGNAIDDPNNSQNGEGTHAFPGVTLQDQLNGGGVPFYATSLFASGVGPVIEATHSDFMYKGKNNSIEFTTKMVDGVRKAVPYCYDDEDDWSLPEEYRFQKGFVLKESFMLPSPAQVDAETNEYTYNPAGTQAIKDMLMQKRAVQIGFTADTSLPNQESEGKYISRNWAHYTYTPEDGANHAVAIVGWDDNYSKENFVEGHNPPADGAWLVKNSWGSEECVFPDRGPGWGIENEKGEHTGYFWLSYYDQSISMPEALDFDKNNVDSSLDDNYIIDSYDYMPVSDITSASMEDEIKMANVFKANSSEQLEQVSCETTSPGTKVINEIYLLADGFKNPTDGILVATTENTFEYGGYHKVNLETPVIIQKDQSYSIVQKHITPDGEYAINMPTSYSKTLAQIMEMPTWTEGVINKNESFVLLDGKWNDYSNESFRDTFFGKGSSMLMSFDNLPIKGFCTKKEDNIKLSVLGNDEIVVGAENPTKIAVRFKGNVDFTGFDAPDIHWALAEGGEKAFTIQTNEDNPYSAYISAKDYASSYLYITVDGVGTTVVPIETNKLAVCSLTLYDENIRYDGKAKKPKITVEDENDDVIPASRYNITYKNNVNAGTATVYIKIKPGDAKYNGDISTTFEILKGINPLKVTGKKVTFKASSLKKKAQAAGASKIIKLTKKGVGKHTFSLVSATKAKKNFKSKFVLASNGKLVVKKGTAKGTYLLKVKVTAAGNKNYYKTAKYAVVRVVVK